jgi:hypothetical protein
VLNVATINAATTDTDKFLVSDSGEVKFRTGAELLSDIGGQAALTNPVTGTGVTGQVSYWSGTGTQAGSNNLFWDNANGRLGIGTTTPTNTLHLSAFNTTNSQIRVSGFEIQSYTINNSWFGDNVFFNGTKFVRRATGFASFFYFYGQEAQFRFGASGNAGTNVTDGFSTDGLVSFKCNLNGFVALGGSISDSQNTYTGAKLLVSGTTGNTILQNGGTFTDSGQRLQVQGTSLLNGGTTISGSTTASSAIARGANITSTLVAAANNDVLVGLDVAPTFTNGAFTGVSNIAARFVAPYVVYQNAAGALGSGYAMEFATNSFIPRVDFVVNGAYVGAIGSNASDLRLSNNQSTSGGIVFETKISTVITAKAKIFNSGNLLLQSGGTFTDAGFRLDVNGTARVQGALTVSTGGASITGDVAISGVLRETVTTNRQTASYTLVLADRGKLVEMNVGSANDLTIPLNSSVAFPIGTKIDIAQYGAGQTTIVATSGVDVRSAGGALKMALQYSGASIVKIGTDEWYLFGDITA